MTAETVETVKIDLRMNLVTARPKHEDLGVKKYGQSVSLIKIVVIIDLVSQFHLHYERFVSHCQPHDNK